MKRRSNLLVVLIFAFVALLVGLGFMIRQSSQITAKNMDDSSARADSALSACEEAESEAVRLAAEAARAKQEAEAKTGKEKAEAKAEAETETEDTFNAAQNLEALQGEDMSELALTDPLPEHHIIFVGDSRTVGMGNAEADTDDECIYVGESGEGLAWFREDGYYQMARAIEEHPDDPVVINLGVNDLTEIINYLDLYVTFADDFPDTKFYYMSVNPVTDECVNVTNSEIREFNRILKETYGKRYLDVNSLMTRDGFEDVDGIHYSEKTYRAIHDYVVRALFGEAD